MKCQELDARAIDTVITAINNAEFNRFQGTEAVQLVKALYQLGDLKKRLMEELERQSAPAPAMTAEPIKQPQEKPEKATPKAPKKGKK